MNQEARNRRKEQIGVVISNKMTKTVAVQVARTMRHPKYGKVFERTKKFYAHDESNALQLGQKVRIMETRPMSKLKRWRVVEAL
jgi:small subunit ribosomal protein S17